MTALTKFRSINWMLLAVALAPTAVFAQQGTATQTQNSQQQNPTDSAPKKTEATQETAEPAQAKTDEEGKLISVPGSKSLGMSILGNQEAPKALVIVPWKQSELGNALGISTMLDDSRQPVDKEVFMRMLSYYEIRSETVRGSSVPAERNATPTNAALRRKP
jgi:hypothetical protein